MRFSQSQQIRFAKPAVVVSGELIIRTKVSQRTATKQAEHDCSLVHHGSVYFPDLCCLGIKKTDRLDNSSKHMRHHQLNLPHGFQNQAHVPCKKTRTLFLPLHLFHNVQGDLRLHNLVFISWFSDPWMRESTLRCHVKALWPPTCGNHAEIKRGWWKHTINCSCPGQR